MFLRITEIEFWKAVDLFKRDKQDEVGYLGDDQFKVCYVGSEKLYYVLAVTHGVFPFNGMTTVQFHYPASLVHEMKYYHLTGELDVTAYNAFEPEFDGVDKFVLAPSSDEVLKLAGYWPEYADYDEHGNPYAFGQKVWHWVTGPDIEPARDYEVLSDRVMSLLGNFSVKFRLDGVEFGKGDTVKIEIIQNGQIISAHKLVSEEPFTVKFRLDRLIETNSDDILEMEFYYV